MPEQIQAYRVCAGRCVRLNADEDGGTERFSLLNGDFRISVR